MSLKSRIEKVERVANPKRGNEMDSIIVCSMPPKYREDGGVIPRQPGDDEGRTPAFAYIMKGPKSGSQVTSIDGETMEEFRVRVKRVAEGLE